MPGGTRHYNFAKELVSRGYSVVIFAASFHHGLYRDLKLSSSEKYKIEKIDGIDFVWLKTTPYKKNDWRRVLNMVSYSWRAYWLGRDLVARNVIKRPDLIIGSSVHLLAVIIAYWLSLCHKTPFVMEVRDLWPQTLVDVGKFKEKNIIIKILRVIEKYLYKKAEKIIVLFPYAKDYIVPLGIAENKIVWISNGVSISIYPEIVAEKKTDDIFKVIYVGAHGVANNLEPIIEAASIIQNQQIKNVRFIFVGNGAEKENLIKKSREIKLKNIEFRDPVKKNLVKNVLHEADALIINLRNVSLMKYGISLNKLYDCMASGKPIIMGGDPINNIVQDSGCGIAVKSGNPGDLAEAVVELYRMTPKLRNELGKKGREYVQKYYSIPVLTDKLENMIKEILDEENDKK